MSKFPHSLNACLLGITLLIFNLSALAQHYIQTNLVSNTGTAKTNDPNLQNAWGLVAAPAVGGGAGSPWWISNNAAGTSTLYSITVAGATVTAHIIPINGNGIVTVPGAPSQQSAGSPTGVMFNGSSKDFILPSGASSRFIFVTEDGTVQGWAGGAASTITVDNSQTPDAANGAVYKGSTIAEIGGNKFILAANFRSGKVDIFDTTFKQVTLSSGEGEGDDDNREAFQDEGIPHGFAPFNIQGVGPNIYVTYAKQDEPRHDPVGGAGFGFVNVFSSEGRLLQRLQHGPWMNAPWGVVWATPGFGEFSNTILVGQFRGGNVSAFNAVTGKFLGNLLNADGTTVLIDGLWALRFGTDGTAGPATTLFFTAGPNGERDGLMGILRPVASPEGIEADEQ
ncbi:MAG TPA: TIGR03118 family protein [Candidatus Saccharimonadales bacterium]|jgi:uncharacterized protein (TIGR03118 family)|nr:TIGR03118 family protein [Candidatus Saccharimonadales bacterium]